MRIQIILAARYLMGRRLRTFLTTLAVLFAALVIFGMNILLPTMLAAFQSNVMSASGQVDATISRKTGDSFAMSVVSRVRAVPGVRAAAGTLSRTVNIPSGFFPRGANVSAVTLVGLDPKPALSLHNYSIKQGRFLNIEDGADAVITRNLADTLGLQVGDTLRLPSTQGAIKLQVIGVRAAANVPGNEEVLVTLAEAQKLLDDEGHINTVEANFSATDEAGREAAKNAIAAQLGDNYQLGALGSGSGVIATVQTAQTAFSTFGFMALFMGGFIIFNTFRTVVVERRRDIGMLRAIGAGRGTIVGLFLVEGLLQGVVGTAAGMLLGYLMALGLLVGMDSLWQQYFHMSLGAPVVSSGLIVMTVSLGVGVTLLSALLPALSASRLTPLEALRPAIAETKRPGISVSTIIGAVLVGGAALAVVSGNTGLSALGSLLFLVGLVMVAPALIGPLATMFGKLVGGVFARDGTGMLAQGNLARQPGRAAVTASATMIGLAIIVTVVGVMASSNGFLVDVLNKAMGSDYMLIPPSVGLWSSDVGASRDLADRLRATPGIGAVSTMRFAMGQVGGKDVSVLGVDPVVFPQVAGLNFQQGNAQSAFAQLTAGRALIANGVFAAQHGLKLGDTVRLSTPAGVQEYTVAAIAGDYFNAKLMTVYISQIAMRQDFHKNEDVFLQMNLAPGAQPAVVEPRLQAVLADYPQFKLMSRQSYQAETTQQLQGAFAAIYMLAAVLALPSLIALLNTLAIGVIERTREIGMLRAIGATQGQVRRMVIAEALLLAAIGTLFGLVGGLYLSYVSVVGLGSTGFPLAYAFPIGGLIAATVIGVTFGALAALAPAKQAAGMEIVTALQYE
jgi:putative ABC transport system permease protein